MKEKKKLWIGLGTALILILIVAAIFLFGNTKDQKEVAGNTEVVESTESTTEETTEETSETTEETKESEAETEETVAETEETEETEVEETLETEAEETEETPETKPTLAPTKEPTPKPTEKPAPTPTPTPSVQTTPESTQPPATTPDPTPEPTQPPATTPTPTPAPGNGQEVMPAPTPTPPSTAPEHEHAWIEEWMYTPTCGNAGYVTVKCSLCGAIDEERTGDVKPLGHTIEGYITNPGDCLTEAVTHYRCTVCGAENVLPHSLSPGPGQPDAHDWVPAKDLVWNEEVFDFVEVDVICCSRCGKLKE